MGGKKSSEDDDSKPPRALVRGAGRRPGRPAANEKGGVSRQGILQAALKLSKSVALQDLSIVVVARSLDVTPALIHYYIGGRDWLTSGIMNLFYKSLIRKWAEPTGDWEQDVENSAKVLFDHLVAYPGISAYLVLNHRFRVFQLTAFGDRDYGAEVLDRFVGHVRAAGLSRERTGLHAQLIHEFVISTAHQATHDLLPADHRQFLEDKLASLDPRRTQNIVYGKVGPLQLNADSLFKEGISMFLLGIRRDREIEGVAGPATPASAKRKRSAK
ncbi:MAG: TetR/AcrR family transcriptional regulator [Sphingomonadales bacterium]|nr:TetR/AcrR family transcriptional regulator [Sphingomonadales bacterium]MBK6493051.1 TetR/AcrR family transcriptional regulator [Sphingomonadales bacterium]MBK6720082.1 TetR/AcrR family transcriptional regulator [Sphingomonadales bacterium]MBK8861054.1 TetR/AcrR family transcriptional regulator [Sphingomonadales bacterium]MBL0001779.1 TetR/AcrR family transcriptional regulator [Sphingomonadales bacterium]